MDVGSGKAETNGFSNFSTGFLNVRPFMTGTQQAFREETIIVKRILMQPLCT